MRTDGRDHYLFVLNYTKEDQRITLHKTMKDLYSGEDKSGDITLGAYGTAVFKFK